MGAKMHYFAVDWYHFRLFGAHVPTNGKGRARTLDWARQHAVWAICDNAGLSCTETTQVFQLRSSDEPGMMTLCADLVVYDKTGAVVNSAIFRLIRDNIE